MRAKLRKTRFGPQPIREVMRRERWSCAALALNVGTSYASLYNAITGVSTPTDELRRRLSAALGEPESTLFTVAVRDRQRASA